MERREQRWKRRQREGRTRVEAGGWTNKADNNAVGTREDR